MTRISGAIRGSTHDTQAARIWQIPRLLREFGLFALGDKGYDGLDHDLVATPFKRKGKPEWQKECNRLHARLRGPGERMFARLKAWGIFDQVRCDPNRVTQTNARCAWLELLIQRSPLRWARAASPRLRTGFVVMALLLLRPPERPRRTFPRDRTGGVMEAANERPCSPD